MLFSLLISSVLFQAGILDAFASGNTKFIESQLADMVIISINDQMDFYDKQKAISVLTDFFADNPPKSCTQTFRSAQSSYQELINADLISAEGRYRLNVVIDKKGAKPLISEIKLFKR